MATTVTASLANRPALAPSRAFTPACRTALKPAVARTRRVVVSTRASAMEFVQIAEEAATKVGDVAAPSWVLPLGVVVVTLGSIASGYLLKPGDDAAKKIQQRDAKSGRFTK